MNSPIGFEEGPSRNTISGYLSMSIRLLIDIGGSLLVSE
jgi:hypothetical protein